jgi:hypothetical protein
MGELLKIAVEFVWIIDSNGSLELPKIKLVKAPILTQLVKEIPRACRCIKNRSQSYPCST